MVAVQWVPTMRVPRCNPRRRKDWSQDRRERIDTAVGDDANIHFVSAHNLARSSDPRISRFCREKWMLMIPPRDWREIRGFVAISDEGRLGNRSSARRQRDDDRQITSCARSIARFFDTAYSCEHAADYYTEITWRNRYRPLRYLCNLFNYIICAYAIRKRPANSESNSESLIISSSVFASREREL